MRHYGTSRYLCRSRPRRGRPRTRQRPACASELESSLILRLAVEDEVRPLRLPGGIGTNRPSSEDRSSTLARRPGLSSGTEASPLRDSAGFAPASLCSASSRESRDDAEPTGRRPGGYG